MKSKTFQDVEVWHRAHIWVLQIYAFSRKFPYDERFGLSLNYDVRRFQYRPILPKGLRKLA